MIARFGSAPGRVDILQRKNIPSSGRACFLGAGARKLGRSRGALMTIRTSGQAPFAFEHCADLHRLPASTAQAEVKLHGTFSVDKRPGQGEIYFGMPGCGIVRVSADLKSQDLIELPAELSPLNFHSTKLTEIEGKLRLVLPANDAALVAVVSLDGKLDFVLSKPEFEQYQNADAAFRPTDTTLHDGTLYVADGYGSNYISLADARARKWTSSFGGPAASPDEHGKFGTAHGITRTPAGDRLVISDRPNARFELFTFDGQFSASYALPKGAWPCGIDYLHHGGRWYAAVGSLIDPVKDRPAPIYILDGETYEVLSTIRPKEELGLGLVQHLHNVTWHVHDDRVYLVCQAWNPGFYFVLGQI
ncbi:MAG TPA: hypothetical protein VGP93_13885 [Polyangiaceae bacterium]|jgi:hypothetical protein|nr:hypothetical protein [Polyangiaceae bacterium]